jgi:predicted RNA-binding protein with PIN domain
MAEHVIIDGNNLLYAMHAHAPVPSVGRETLVKVVERWARGGDDDVTLVFDGPAPRGGLGKQMSSSRIRVSFAAPRRADDVIDGLISSAKHPDRIRVISNDGGVRRAARRRRSRETKADQFVAELFATKTRREVATRPPALDKPAVEPDDADDWLNWFGIDEDHT